MTQREKAVRSSIFEAERYLDRARASLEAGDDWDKQPAMKSGAMKRASLDLSASLAVMRKSKKYQ